MSPDLEGPPELGGPPELERHNRRTFLRQLGKTLAIGMGVALVPAARASAGPQNYAYCCPNYSVCPQNKCVTGLPLYCESIGCCVCDYYSDCHTYTYPPC
jgi:hypothetical protein